MSEKAQAEACGYQVALIEQKKVAATFRLRYIKKGKPSYVQPSFD